MTSSRKPNWKKWSLMPDAQIWEVVALSLNIDPSKVKHNPHSWMLGSGEKLFTESQQFNDRIDIIKRNLNQSILKITELNLVDSVKVKVTIASFALFAQKVNWKLPAQFPCQEVTDSHEESNLKEQSKYTNKSEKQLTEISNALIHAGYDPEKLPRNKPGKPGVKSEVKRMLLGNKGLFTESSFEHAWKRFRKMTVGA